MNNEDDYQHIMQIPLVKLKLFTTPNKTTGSFYGVTGFPEQQLPCTAMCSLESAPALELFYEHEDKQQDKHPVADDAIHRGWNSGVPLTLEFSEGKDSGLAKQTAS